jgi:NADPH:quinone reductase-like Zn-dependent oxidoreductase
MPHAIQYDDYGPPEVLHLADVPELTPGSGRVRVAVRASGVNPFDWKVRSGAFRQAFSVDFPNTPGSEFSGVIDQVGEGVTRFAVGDEVLGRGDATYAEQVLADPAAIERKPAAMSWEQAAALPVAVSAAYRVLAPLGLEPGQTLVVNGAAGGVGGVLVQIAQARGLKVIGTASERNHERLRQLGVTPVLYGDGLAERVRALAPDGVDGAADLAGKGALDALVELTGDAAKVITIADSEGAKRRGARFTGGADQAPLDALAEAIGLVEDGRLVVPVGSVYPLAEAAAAQAESESGRSDGRIVLRVG